jgi:hypothetical protein
VRRKVEVDLLSMPPLARVAIVVIVGTVYVAVVLPCRLQTSAVSLGEISSLRNWELY